MISLGFAAFFMVASLYLMQFATELTLIPIVALFTIGLGIAAKASDS